MEHFQGEKNESKDLCRCRDAPGGMSHGGQREMRKHAAEAHSHSGGS